MLPFYEQIKHWALDDDMRGFDCLGADLSALPAMQAALPVASSIVQMTQGEIAAKNAAEAAQRKKFAGAISTLAISGVVGGVVGGVGGALLWPAHRIIGFLIGSIVVGAPAGTGIGVAIAAQKAAK